MSAVRGEPAGRGGRRDLPGLLADPRHARLDASDIAVVVAHPDDETIGIGGQLARLAGVTLVHVTDGAPRNAADAAAHGFATSGEYAAARRRELEDAAAEAGIAPGSLLGLGYPDQEAARNLAAIARELAGLVRERGIAVLVTHAYEGGHPDHDATAFAVHAAARLVGEGDRPAIVEMPFYHAGPEGWVRQEFCGDAALPEAAVVLDARTMTAKRRMLAAHRTQEQTLRFFDSEVERFRAAPDYDFTVLPNGGRLLYEAYGWGLTGDDWRRLAAEALAELGLSRWP